MEMPAMSPAPAPRKNTTNIILMILVPILLLGNVATLYFLFSKPALAPTSNNNAVVDVNENIDDNESIVLEQEKIILENTGGVSENNESSDIQVTFTDWPIIIENYSFFDYDKINQIVSTLAKDASNDNSQLNSLTNKFMDQLVVYKVGEVNSGKYIDKDLVIVRYQPEAPMGPLTYRVIKNNDEYVFITKQSQELFNDAILNKLFTKYNNLNILGLDVPSSISIPNSSISLQEEIVFL